jgi:3-oxoacyl-[acyl-carrier protein] reductase
VRQLSGKVALVTGGSRNIGRAIAHALAAAGTHIAVVGRRDADAAHGVAVELRARGVEAESFLADVANEDDVRHAVTATVARFGRLDILVNNASVRTEMPFADLTLSAWREVIGVALDGAFLCSRTALPHLAASGAGTIVNIGGLTAYTGAKHRAHVVAAKAGLDGLTRALAVELAPLNITVNLVAPGLIDTARSGAAPDHHRHSGTLVGRRGTPEEVAAMVCYLAGPAARFITGQAFHVNGGAYLG